MKDQLKPIVEKIKSLPTEDLSMIIEELTIWLEETVLSSIFLSIWKKLWLEEETAWIVEEWSATEEPKDKEADKAFEWEKTEQTWEVPSQDDVGMKKIMEQFLL